MSQSETDYQILVEKLEDLTRLGKSNLVLAELQKLSFAQLPRTFRFPLADIARRISMPLLALKMMNPIIRGADGEIQAPEPKELIVYATSLTSLGCHQEAIDILSKIPTSNNPEVDLFLSFAHFGRWEYKRTIPILKRYVDLSGLTEYQKIVGKVNLLAALVSEGLWSEADFEIQELLKVTRERNYKLLHGNTLELQAQSYVSRKQYSEALNSLKKAQEILTSTSGIYFQFVRKWQVITKLLINPDDSQAKEERSRLRATAIHSRSWEIVRDLDLYLGLALKDEAQYLQVLSATPFVAYRRRAERILGHPIDLPKNYLRTTFPSTENSDTLNVVKEIDYQNWPSSFLNVTKFRPTLYTTMEILTRDGYKPMPLGELYSRLYPKTYFAPLTSEKRIHNVLYRLRQIFVALDWPLQIHTQNNEFFIQPAKPGIAIRKTLLPLHIHEIFLSYLHKMFKDHSFTSSEATKALGLSKRYTNNLIKIGISKNRLLKIGQGRSISYRFSNRKGLTINKASKPSESGSK